MDDFSDDGLDDLEENDLQELENAAITFTQKQTNNPVLSNGDGSNTPFVYAQGQQGESTDGVHYEDDDLDDTFVIDANDNTLYANNPVANQLPQQQQRSQPYQQYQPYQPPQQPPYRQDPSEDPLRGTYLLSRAIPTANGSLYNESPFSGPQYSAPRFNPQPQHATQNAFTGSQLNPTFRPASSRQFPAGSQYVRPTAPSQRPQGRFLAETLPGRPNEPAAAGDIVSALRLRVRNLEMDLTSAKGEASILRNKHEAAQKAHDADLARIRKQHTEQMSRQERAVEAAVAAQKSASTELLFTKQDLKEELDKGRKGRNDKNTSPTKLTSATPKKTQRWAVADGFEDAEIMPSPSKASGRRGKDLFVAPVIGDRTPKGKRKRGVVDSPLELEESFTSPKTAAPIEPPSPAPAIREVYPLELKFASKKLDLTEIVVNHSVYKGGPTTFDKFARYVLPSDDPRSSFASQLFSQLPHMGTPTEPKQVYVDFCLMLCNLWSRCITEKYHDPILDLCGLLTFLLQMHTTYIAPRIVAYLVPPALETVCIVTFDVFQSKFPDANIHGAVQALHPKIPTTESLSLLYLVALACTTHPPPPLDNTDPEPHPLWQFWQHMTFDFTLSTLNYKQDPTHFMGALALLRLSSLPASIGPIVSSNPQHTPVFVAGHVLDRVSYILESPPKWTLPTDSLRQISLRIEVLATLAAFGRTPFGRTRMAEHATVIPRLVNTLCWAIDQLYDVEDPEGFDILSDDDIPRPEGMSDTDFAAHKAEALADDDSMIMNLDDDDYIDEKDEKAQLNKKIRLHVEVIRDCVLVLHRIIASTRGGEPVDVNGKLAGAHGASQRYLLVLGRLNFSDDLIYERGIDAVTQSRAHELLELAVTPVDGERVEAVFV